MRNFASPHVHIQSLDSASTPLAFAKREVELDTGVITVTDHGTLAACQSVYELARSGIEVKGADGKKTKVKLTPILGLEGYFRDDDCPILTAAGIQKSHPKKYKSKDLDLTRPAGFSHHIKYHHLTIHFLDQAAFQTGIRLLSKAPVEQHGSEAKPLFNWRDLEELGAANTTITTGCLIGMVQRHLLDHSDPEMARKYYERLRAIVKPGNFYVEVFPHVCSHNWQEGVFITVQDANGEEQTLKYYAGKTLKTNAGEVKAQELAHVFGRGKHDTLIAVKDYHTWTDREPSRIIKVHYDPGSFIQNECKPYAPGGDVQLGANQFMLEMAKKYGDPVLISDDSHYAHPEEKIVQDVRLAQSGSWRFFGSYHRQSSSDAFAYFQEKMGVSEKEFEGWVENSYAWAEKFKGFKLESKPELPVKFFEPLYAEVGAKNSLEYTMHLIKQHGRMNWGDPVRVARLEQEIKLLYQNGIVDLLPYFFIDEEVCRFYRDQGMLTGPGRGSAAGLSLSYLLGITHVDPIDYGLSVDRFLTLDRIKSGKWPDIDQDLPTRDPLVGEDGSGGWLQQRYGDHVAQISTIMTLKLRSAVLDVARFTLGAVPKDIADLAHHFEMPPQGLEDHKFVFGYEDSGNWVKGSIEYDENLQKYIKAYPEQWEIVQKCLGLGRSISRHACAYVIANRPIWEFIPLTQINGVTCTQFTAPSVEAAGGLKMDFLIINSLNDIANAIKLIQKNATIPKEGATIRGRWVPALRLVPYQGSLVDIWDLPPAQDVFADVATGKTETVFQLNTPAAQQWLRHFGHQKEDGTYPINSIEDMSAFTALDRPGPLDAKVTTPGYEPKGVQEGGTVTQLDTPGGDNTGTTVVSPDRGGKGGKQKEEGGQHNMLVEYARRARGLPPSPDIFVIFDKLFPETHGVMVYQEQLQRLYQEVRGCSGAEAEEFRSNVAKKKKEKVIAAYPGFIEGATKTMGSKENAEAVWQFIQSWAAYGFNKSHSVCYMVIAYACAFLKHHYPLEWWTAVLCNATKEEINEKFWKHCGKYINLPDVTKACLNFEIINDRIQAPLSLLHGIGPGAHKELLENAPYTDIADFIAKREAHKARGTTVVMVPEVEKVELTNGAIEERETGRMKEKTVKGRSALHDGIAYRLIVSGAMDALFPPKTSTLGMLERYEQAVWDQAQIGKKKPSKKPPKAIKPEFADIDPMTRYQMRKQILPAYSESVLKLLISTGHEAAVHSHGAWRHPSGLVLYTSPREFAGLQKTEPPKDRGVRRALAGYVESIRVFEYGEKDPETGRRLNPRAACEVNLDFDGDKVKLVRWPDRETGVLDSRFRKDLEGSLVVVSAVKFKVNKPFSIDDIYIIQPALGEAKEEEEKEESK